MSNNTVLTDAQKARDWWFVENNQIDRISLRKRYHFPITERLSDLEIINIWRSESQQSLPSETLTDRLLDNPAQEEEDYNDFIDAAIPSNTGEVKGEEEGKE